MCLCVGIMPKRKMVQMETGRIAKAEAQGTMVIDEFQAHALKVAGSRKKVVRIISKALQEATRDCNNSQL